VTAGIWDAISATVCAAVLCPVADGTELEAMSVSVRPAESVFSEPSIETNNSYHFLDTITSYQTYSGVKNPRGSLL
jgi:hypothetical protein